MPVSHRRSVPSGRMRPQHRKLVWATSSVTHTIAAGAKTNDDLLANLETVGASVLGATIMRIHTKIAITQTAADASLGVFAGWIVDTAPTVTNLDPATSFGDDWMLLTELAPSTGTQVQTVGTVIFYGENFDIRSKRKCEELNEKLFLCLTNAGSGSVTLGAFSRTLIALP